MTWAQRLKRVFHVDTEMCRHWQGPVKIIACIEDPVVIETILSHLRSKTTTPSQTELPLLPKAMASPVLIKGLWMECMLKDDATLRLAGQCLVVWLLSMVENGRSRQTY
jgi:hypothetical protein